MTRDAKSPGPERELGPTFENAPVALVALGQGGQPIAVNRAGRNLGVTVEALKHDSTELRGKEEALAQSRRIESLGYVTASAVHDFNNLLTPILCASTLLGLELEHGTNAHCMSTEIRIAAERAAELVRQLMRFARRQPHVTHRVEINAAIRELAPLMTRGLPEDIQLVLELEGERLDATVDRARFENALLNLVANARDAMPAGGRVVVATAAGSRAAGDEGGTETTVILSVTDDGQGMSPEVHTRLNERLFTTKMGRGTGLGLPAVRAFVVESGGHMTIHSELNEGTSVVIHLPRAPASDRAEAEMPPSRAMSRGSEAILIVEDDEAVRRALSSVLERQGYLVVTAPSGVDALGMATGASCIDLVIVDVVMPQMSGREFVNRLRAKGHDPKVLFASGHTDEVIEDRGVRSGAEALIRKPFTAEDLLGKVRAVLDER